jgi:serine/threonine protein kinase
MDGKDDSELALLWSHLRMPADGEDISMREKALAMIERKPSLALAPCPPNEGVSVPVFSHLDGKWVRIGPGAGQQTGLRAGQIARVVMLYRDKVHVQVEELSHSAMRFIGVNAACLRPFDFRGWLPVHAAAFAGWPAGPLSKLLDLSGDAVYLAADGTGGMQPIDLLPVAAGVSVWRPLVSRVWTADDGASQSELLWWLLDRSQEDSTAATEAAKLVKLHPELAGSVCQRPISAAQCKGALVRVRPGIDEKDGFAVSEIARATRVYPYLDDGARGEGAREVDIKVLGSGRDVEVRGPPLELVSATDGFYLLHAAALVGWPLEALKTLLSCEAAYDTATQPAPGTTMFAPHLARLGGAPMESVATLAAAAFPNGCRNLTDEYAAIFLERDSCLSRQQSVGNDIDDDVEVHDSADLHCVSVLVNDLGVCPERLLLAAAAASAVGIAQVLVAHHSARGVRPVAGDGRIARDLGFASSNANAAEFFGRLGALHGRYRMDSGPAIHRSLTCVVHFAIDIDTGEKVCLKRMRDMHQFRREISSRAVSIGVDTAVVRLLGWHTPADSTVEGSGQRPEPTDEPDQESSIASSKAAWALEPLLIRSSKSTYPYLLVMQRGGPSLQLSVSTQRIAGCSADAVKTIFYNLARQVADFHKCGLVHCDVKLRNVLGRIGCELLELDVSTPSVLLCDLDSSHRVDETLDEHSKIGSSGYFAPEVARLAVARHANDISEIPVPVVTVGPALDVWSLGVVLFELCTGRHLFPQDISNDEMVEPQDMLRLCSWLCISDDSLASVFVEDPLCSSKRRNAVHQLIRWCLQGDPAMRPSMEQLLNHPFLVTETSTTQDSESCTPLRMKFHLFVSHIQTEAAGDVGTLCRRFEKMGLHCWRDMDQADLTEAGMRAGVKDSDVFVLFLTNSVLSSPWCIKEITWAVEFERPILIIAEQEERFYPFDIDRWRTNCCSKRSGGGYKKGHLRVPYERCPAVIKHLVEQHEAEGLVLPFRRRDFEIDALAREVVARASQVVKWGQVLPPAVDAAQIASERRVCVICDEGEDAIRVRSDILTTLKGLAPGIRDCSNECPTFGEHSETPPQTTHTIVLLSARLLDQIQGVAECATDVNEDQLRSEVNTEKLSALASRARAAGATAVDIERALDSVDIKAELIGMLLNYRSRAALLEGRILRCTGTLLCVFVSELGWKFDDFYAAPESAIKSAIAEHEALRYKPVAPAQLLYEHKAMVAELLRRMRPVTPGHRPVEAGDR